MPYIPGNIPVELKSLPIWALATEGQVNRYGVPFSPKAPIFPVEDQDYCRGVMPTNPAQWRTFNEVDAWQDIIGGYPGLMVSNGYIGFDFDLEKADPAMKQWIEAEVLPRCPGYIERSPSGVGARVIMKGDIPISRKTKVIEVYNKHRFLRMTGDTITATMPMDPQAWVDWVYSLLPTLTGFLDVDSTPVSLDCNLTSEELEQRYHEILDDLPPHERNNIEKIDRGDFTDGSEAARIVVIALLRRESDAATVFSMLLANEGIQNHYWSKYGAQAAAQLARKFTNDWFPKGAKIAAIANEVDEQTAAVVPQIKAMYEAAVAKEADAEQEKNRESLARFKQPPPEMTDVTVFPEFPVQIVRDYRDWLRTSVIETEEMLVNAAALSHLSALVARRFCTESESLLNLYIVVLARQGAGKEVLSGGFTKMLMQTNQRGMTMSLPRSDIALHKEMLDKPSALLILKEFGDRLSEWTRIGHPARMVPSILKDVYGINAGGVFTGTSYSDAAKNVDPVVNPAISILCEGTREQILNALGNYGTNDGFVGRLLFIESSTDYIDNPHPVSAMPDHLAQFMRDFAGVAGALPSNPPPVVIPCSDEARAMFAAFKREELSQKRNENNPYMPFWRAATQNAYKMATTMAVYAGAKGRTVDALVTAEFADWAIRVVRYSIAQATKHMDVDAAYSTVDRKAAAALEQMIGNFFTWKGGTPQAQKLREQGQFKVSYLGRKLAGITDHPKGEHIAVEIAVSMLLTDGKIELVEENTKRSFRGQQVGCFRLGDMWGRTF